MKLFWTRKKRWIRIATTGFIVLVAVILLVGCKGTSEKEGQKTGNETVEMGEISLKVWVPMNQEEITKKMCDIYIQNHPDENIKIECKTVDQWNGTSMLTYDREAAADILLCSTSDFGWLSNSGLLYPITINLDEIKKQYMPKAIQSATYNELLYGIPIEANTWIQYYNKSLCSEEDIRSLDTIMSKDTSANYNFSCVLRDSWYFEAFYYAAGCTLFGPDGTTKGECSWNDANGLKATDYMLDLLQHKNYYEDSDGKAIDYFKEGSLAVYCDTTWCGRDLKEALGDQLGAEKLPTINIDGTDSQLSNFLDYSAFCVNSITEHPKAAMELAEWLGGLECQQMRYEEVGTIPTRIDLLNQEPIASDVIATAVKNQVEVATLQPRIVQMNDYWSVSAAFGEELVSGVITKENMQEKLDILVDGITIEFIQK